MLTMQARPARKTVQLSEETVQAALDGAESQADYIVRIYKLVFPDWDQIKRIDGWPAVTQRTWVRIGEMCVAWDKAHFPADDQALRACFPGGAWLNNGFTTAGGLAYFEVDLSTCTVHY